MSNWRLRGLRGDSRRGFLKLMGLAAASLGLERSRYMNYLVDRGGHELADAAIVNTNRFVCINAHTGLLGWFQQLWPHVACATTADANPNYCYLYSNNHGPGLPKGTHWLGGDRPFYYSPDAPWFDQINGVPLRPVTGIMAGGDETHVLLPQTAQALGPSSKLPSGITAMQYASSNVLVPVLGVTPFFYGATVGAPEPASVANGAGLIDLFDSAARRFTLEAPEDQATFRAYWDAIAGLRAPAARSTWQPQLTTARGAVKLLGLDFGDQLTPDQADFDLYGVTALNALNTTTDLAPTQKTGLLDLANILIIVARAFKLGLSKSALIGMSRLNNDGVYVDPHTCFATPVKSRNVTKHLGVMLDAFYADLETAVDPEYPDQTLGQTTVFMAYGDTPKTPWNSSGYPDSTPQACNWAYVMGQGYIKDGWFGGCDQPAPGQSVNDAPVRGFDAVTGAESTNILSNNTATACGAAAAFAVARGDWNSVAQHFTGPKVEAMINE